MNKIEKKEWIAWIFEWISGGLKELMDKITWWINEILIKLWLKKEKEKKETEEWTTENLSEVEKDIFWEITKEELKNLMENVSDNNELDQNELDLIENDLIKNENINKYFERIESSNIPEEQKKLEKENVLNEIEKITESDDEEDLEKLEKCIQDEKLQETIIGIYEENENHNYSVEEISKIYEQIEETKEEGEEITKEEVLEKLNNNQ